MDSFIYFWIKIDSWEKFKGNWFSDPKQWIAFTETAS